MLLELLEFITTICARKLHCFALQSLDFNYLYHYFVWLASTVLNSCIDSLDDGQMLMTQLDPLTEQQVMGIYNWWVNIATDELAEMEQEQYKP